MPGFHSTFAWSRDVGEAAEVDAVAAADTGAEVLELRPWPERR
jgi:hypothetical protein